MSTFAKIDAGTFTLPGTANVPFFGNGAPVAQGGHGLTLKAPTANSGQVFIGGDAAGDATNMYPIDKGEILNIDILNPKTIRVKGASGDKLHWVRISS